MEVFDPLRSEASSCLDLAYDIFWFPPSVIGVIGTGYGVWDS